MTAVRNAYDIALRPNDEPTSNREVCVSWNFPTIEQLFNNQKQKTKIKVHAVVSPGVKR